MHHSKTGIRSGKWINFGDVNPREHGGCFVKYHAQVDEFEIVETTNLEDHDDFPKKYMISTEMVEKEKLLNDKELSSYAGADEIMDNDTKLQYLVTAYIQYYGGDSVMTNNYWGTLKEHGINQSN